MHVDADIIEDEIANSFSEIGDDKNEIIEEKTEVVEKAKDTGDNMNALQNEQSVNEKQLNLLGSSQKLKKKAEIDFKSEVKTIARPASGRSRNQERQ